MSYDDIFIFKTPGGLEASKMFNFTPLLGAQSVSCASQSLLEFEGGIKVLIDVGWDENFDVEELQSLERWVIQT